MSSSTSCSYSVSSEEKSTEALATKDPPIKSTNLPLPLDYFKCPPYSQEQINSLLEKSRQTWVEFVQFALGKDSNHWGFVSQERGVTIEKVRNHTKHSKLAYYRGIVQFEACLDEAIDAQIMDTTKRYRKDGKKMSEDILDGLVLHTLIPRTESHLSHYAALKWVALEPPAKFVKPRDLCFMEYCDEFTDENGQRTWVKCMHSIELSWCPSLYETHGLVRGAIYRTGFLFRTIPSSSLIECIHATQFDPKGNVPSWATNIACRRRISCIYYLGRRLQQRRFKNEHFLKKQDYVPKYSQNHCMVCQRNFGSWGRRYNCRLCGNVICTKCHQKWSIPIPVVGITKIRICTVCTIKSRQQHLKSNILEGTLERKHSQIFQYCMECKQHHFDVYHTCVQQKRLSLH